MFVACVLAYHALFFFLFLFFFHSYPLTPFHHPAMTWKENKRKRWGEGRIFVYLERRWRSAAARACSMSMPIAVLLLLLLDTVSAVARAP